MDPVEEDNACLIQKRVNEHRNELVLDLFEAVKLLGWTDIPDDDYYYVMGYKNRIKLHSCVMDFIVLKGKIEESEYQYLERIWKLNQHVDYEEEIKKKGIALK